MKYMGIIVISQNMKKKKTSSAMNTAIIAPSTSSTRHMNALTCVSIDRQDERTQSGESPAVSTTISMLMPSTPTAY